MNQSVINAFEAWEQVPWATVVLNYDGASTVTGGTQNGVNDVFFGTVRGTVKVAFSANVWNGAAVLAVNLSTGGAVVGTISGSYNIRTSGTTGNLGTDGTGQYELPCLPVGSYAVFACPLLNYFSGTSRLSGTSGWTQAMLDVANQPGARTLTVSAGSLRTGINFDGNHGDVNGDGIWSSADVSILDSFVANPSAFPWLIAAGMINVLDLNNDGTVNATDRAMLVQLTTMTSVSAVAGSVF